MQPLFSQNKKMIPKTPEMTPHPVTLDLSSGPTSHVSLLSSPGEHDSTN